MRAEVLTNAGSQLLSRQDAVSFGYCTLAMHPLRLDVVQPGAFGRQKARDDLHAGFSFSPATKHLAVVLPYPITHFPADVPGGIIPDEHQHSLAFFGQAFTYPLQVSYAHMAHRSSINEAQQHLTSVFPKQPVTAQRLGVRVIIALATFWSLRRIELLQTQRLTLFGPGVHTWLGKPAPPHFVCIANHPTLFYPAGSPSNQEVASLFLRVYSGSGEVIQSLARCHPTPSRCRVTRIRSMLTSRSVTRCSKQTSAASASVHTEVGLPKVRGLWCKMARNRSALWGSKMGCTVFGRRDLGCKQPSSSEWKAEITLRTICKEQPRLRAISDGRWPLEEASSIWQRRIVKASEERSPAAMACCSFSVSGRTNNGAFMPYSTNFTHVFTHYLS